MLPPCTCKYSRRARYLLLCFSHSALLAALCVLAAPGNEAPTLGCCTVICPAMLCLRVQHEREVAAPLEVDGEPFSYRPLPASGHVYEMVDGVVRVWPDAQTR